MKKPVSINSRTLSKNAFPDDVKAREKEKFAKEALLENLKRQTKDPINEVIAGGKDPDPIIEVIGEQENPPDPSPPPPKPVVHNLKATLSVNFSCATMETHGYPLLIEAGYGWEKQFPVTPVKTGHNDAVMRSTPLRWMKEGVALKIYEGNELVQVIDDKATGLRIKDELAAGKEFNVDLKLPDGTYNLLFCDRAQSLENCKLEEGMGLGFNAFFGYYFSQAKKYSNSLPDKNNPYLHMPSGFIGGILVKNGEVVFHDSIAAELHSEINPTKNGFHGNYLNDSHKAALSEYGYQYEYESVQYNRWDPVLYFAKTQAPYDICDQVYSPLIIELQGEGIRLSSAKDGVYFDIDNKGAQARVAWPQDPKAAGFLVLDRNNNGKIDGINELFGNHTVGPDGYSSANGFLALKKYNTHHDKNSEHIIDQRDEIFAKLQVWRDYNRDGQAQKHELNTLSELDIKSIQLNYSLGIEVDIHGNETRQRSLVEKHDGSSLRILDIWLKQDK